MSGAIASMAEKKSLRAATKAEPVRRVKARRYSFTPCFHAVATSPRPVVRPMNRLTMAVSNTALSRSGARRKSTACTAGGVSRITRS